VGADLAEPAHRVAVELQLVDRLTGADPAQLRRSVRGQHDQRDRRLVGLGDRGVQVGGRGPGSAEDGNGPARGLRRAEREEAGRALVDDHGRLDRRLAPKRDGKRGRARAGGEDRMARAAAGELLDQRRGKRRVAVGRVHVRPGN
jgi:hypothetical protein